VAENDVAHAGGIGDVILHDTPSDAVERLLAGSLRRLRSRRVNVAVRMGLDTVEPAVGDDGVGLLHPHARLPIDPRAGQNAAEVTHCRGCVEVFAILDHTVLDPAELGVARCIVVSIERDSVVVGLEDAVPNREMPAATEVDPLLVALQHDIIDEQVLEGADLQAELPAPQVEASVMLDAEIFDVEKGKLAA
jgi:hypothetical protein